MQIPSRKPERYQIIKKVGRGKYSEVFKGVDMTTNEFVGIKYLKPVRPKKISRWPCRRVLMRREVKIMTQLRGGPSILPVYSLRVASQTASWMCEESCYPRSEYHHEMGGIEGL